MIFLNSAVLLGLGAVAIPILIHLINRRKAPVLEWGAMRFLRASLSARQRRTLIEELILMVLRCLLVALIVMAVARPFVPSTSGIPWALVLPAVPAAAICAGAGTVMRSRRAVSWVLFGLAGLLFGGALVASFVEYVLQGKQWRATGGGQDVAIVVDGSMSMTLVVDGRSNFQRAVEEAHAVVHACRAADTVSLILASAAPREPVVGPTSDFGLVSSALDTLAPTNGPMGLLAALDVAAGALTKAHNPAKKIVLITDGQSVGWEARAEARWQFLAGTFKQLPTAPQIICRTLSLPAEYDNAAIGDITLARAVVGSDRPVRIDVQVLNCGTVRTEASSVEFAVDSSDPEQEQVGAIEPNAAEAVHFTHRFDAPGPHLISVHLTRDDVLPADNTAVRVVDVLAKLPVLLIDGAPSSRPLDSAASFMALAMSPAEGGRGYLIEPTVVPITEVGELRDLSTYRVVVLANVANLPPPAATTLGVFVRNGGGLLIAPGGRAEPGFYNDWRAEEAEPFTPGRLAEWRSVPDNPMRLGLKTFSHPALALIAEPSQSDAGSATADAYWRVEVSDNDPSVRVGGRFESGDPFLVERKVGKGFVLMTALPLGARDTNLPALKCFVPLMHELTYYLAAPTIAESNVKPGTTVSFEVPAPERAASSEVEVVTPSNARRPAEVTSAGKAMTVRCSWTGEPGLYRITLPRAQEAGGNGGETVPFVVLGDPAESRLTALTDADLERARKKVAISRARTTDEMTAALIGDIPGEEVWKQLAACALLALIAETAVAGWITVQRRSHSVEEVRFGSESVDSQSLRDKLRQKPAPAGENP